MVIYGTRIRDYYNQTKTNFDEVLLLVAQFKGKDLNRERAEFSNLRKKVRL